MSQAKEVLTIQQVIREKVMSLLNWNDLQYGEFLMDKGETYLNVMMCLDAYTIERLKVDASYWAWWKNHYSKRDEDFIAIAKYLDLPARIDLYEKTHNPFSVQFTPHKSIINNALKGNQKPSVNDLQRQLDEMLEQAEQLANIIRNMRGKVKV